MNGPLDLVNLLVAFLGVEVPVRMPPTIGANSYTLDGGTTAKTVGLKPLADIHAVGRAQVDRLPCIEIEPGPAGGVGDIATDEDGNLWWRIRYTPRLLCWVRGDDYDDTSAAVGVLAATVKQALFADMTIGTGVPGPALCRLDPLTWRESDTLVRVAGNTARELQGRSLEATVDVYETAVPVAEVFPAGSVPAPPHTIEVDVEPLAFAEVTG